MTLSSPRSFIDAATTWSTLSHIGLGIVDISMPARSWNSVRMKPGHSACTRTPVPANPPDSPSVNEMT